MTNDSLIARRRFIWRATLCACSAAGAGCVPFRAAGTKDVRGSAVRVGPTRRECVGYRALIPISFPTDQNPVLKLRVEKDLRVTVEYRMSVHKERILKRTPTRVQHSIENVGKDFNNNVLGGLISLGLLPAYMLLDLHPAISKPKEETTYEPIPGSETSEASFKDESTVEVAAGETLLAFGIGQMTTDSDGIASFVAQPGLFDQGVRIRHEASGRVYLVRRRVTERKTRAEWYSTAKLAYGIYSAGAAVVKVRKIIKAGGGPTAFIVAVIVDYATDTIVGFILEAAATRTETFFQWDVIETR